MKQRRSWDSQGNPIVEVQTEDGFRRPARADDTALRRLKASDLSLAETRPVKKIDFMPAPDRGARPEKAVRSPYGNRASAPQEKQLRQRSSLDYLRALSEEIKRRRERGEK